MTKIDDLHTLVRLLQEFDLPISPILEYAIKEKEEKLSAINNTILKEESVEEKSDYTLKMDRSVTYASLKEKFSEYLLINKSKKTVRNYLYAIDNTIRFHINRVVDTELDSIYSFTNVADVQCCLAKLKADEQFVAANQVSHNIFTAAISSYIKFLEGRFNL